MKEVPNLDRLDMEAIANAMRVMTEDLGLNVRIRSATFDIYDEHRVTVSRGRARFGPLRLRKVVRLP